MAAGDSTVAVVVVSSSLASTPVAPASAVTGAVEVSGAERLMASEVASTIVGVVDVAEVSAATGATASSVGAATASSIMVGADSTAAESVLVVAAS